MKTTATAWREHFSRNAADLIQIHRVFCGQSIAHRIMMECFKRSKRAQRINEATVCAVLSDLNIQTDDDGNYWIEA